jgi:hypothetical protein
MQSILQCTEGCEKERGKGGIRFLEEIHYLKHFISVKLFGDMGIIFNKFVI